MNMLSNATLNSVPSATNDDVWQFTCASFEFFLAVLQHCFFEVFFDTMSTQLALQLFGLLNAKWCIIQAYTPMTQNNFGTT